MIILRSYMHLDTKATNREPQPYINRASHRAQLTYNARAQLMTQLSTTYKYTMYYGPRPEQSHIKDLVLVHADIISAHLLIRSRYLASRTYSTVKYSIIRIGNVLPT